MKSKQQVALASFPRSGNTWLRYLIEEATGKKSGSVYQDRILKRSDHGVVIKTHELDSDCYQSTIHLVRNPFDAIESYFYWKKDIARDEEVTWNEHFEKSVLEWRAHTEHWLQANCPSYRVRYEDLHHNPVDQLRLILMWLGYKLSPEKLVLAVEESQLSKLREKEPELGLKFFRRGKIGKGIEHFTDEQRCFLIDKLGDLLSEFNY